MSDSMKAIADDIREYERLCSLAGEKVQYKRTDYGVESPDCYGDHARRLKVKYNK